MKISQIVESVAGVTSSASIASTESALGGVQTRSQKPPKSPKVKTMRDKGKKFVNQISESDQTPVSEAELSEQDLIIVPGMRKSKDTSFIPHKADRRDHEVEMARSDLLAAAKNAMRMYHLLKDRTEDQGLMGWQQSYITLATDYLQSVADNLEYDARTDEMTGGVIAGGGVGESVAEAEKPGLWANIHAKRERIKHGSGERMRKPGSKGAPTAQAFKQSQKTSKKK